MSNGLPCHVIPCVTILLILNEKVSKLNWRTNTKLNIFWPYKLNVPTIGLRSRSPLKREQIKPIPSNSPKLQLTPSNKCIEITIYLCKWTLFFQKNKIRRQ